MAYYLKIIFYICINILALYTVNTAMQIYLGSDSNTKLVTKIISYTIYLFIGVFTYLQVDMILINLVVSIFLIFLLTLTYNSSIIRKVVFSFSWIGFVIIIEIIVSTFYGILLQKSLDVLVDDEISKLIATIIYTLITLVIVKSNYIYNNKIQHTDKLSVIDSLYVGIIPLCSIALLYFFAKIGLMYKINNYIIIISCILIIFINIFFFVLFDKLKIAEKVKYENELLKKQSEYYFRLEEHINNTFDNINTIKHDLKYHLLFLKAKTEDNSIEAIEDIKSTLDTLITETLSDNFVEYTKNKELNRLLNYKLFKASQNIIPLDVKVNICDDAYIDEHSLYIILGNAIDNAVRNFDSSKSDVKDIVIRIFDDCDNLYIKISNPYSKKLYFKNGLPITDKRDREFHNIGLKSIRTLVESKNGYFNISTDNNLFTVEILLYDEVQHKSSYQI